MILRFVWMGIGHIGALASEWFGPNGFHLPEGIDHILFLVALALGGGGLKDLLKTATGFTVGHSVTLALAFFGIVHVPPRWVEAAIALSIAYVAAEDLLRRGFKERWRVAMFFGLIHGFGFATALQQLHLDKRGMLVALAGFNLGVEIGQAMILATLVPLVSAMKAEPALRKYALSPCSLAVFCSGAYWFALRVFA